MLEQNPVGISVITLQVGHLKKKCASTMMFQFYNYNCILFSFSYLLF